MHISGFFSQIPAIFPKESTESATLVYVRSEKMSFEQTNAPPSQERIPEVVRKVVAEQIPNLVAVDGEALLGIVEVFPGTMSGLSGEEADLTGFLDIQIAATHRRQGLGLELMRIAIEDSVRYGFKCMELHVLETNHAAIRPRRLGFRMSGVAKRR